MFSNNFDSPRQQKVAEMIIPGLSFVPPEESEIIELPSFCGTVQVPQSHRYGNCRPREEFEKMGVVYEGNFGSIYKCKDMRNGKIYAVKKFNFTPEMLKNGMPASFLREISVLRVLTHDNIVNSHGTVAGQMLENNLLVLDFCSTSLHELIVKKCVRIYERDVVKYMMRQLFDGLSYMHESLVIHRNISCRNILFTEYGILKIGGFRTARFYDPQNMTPSETELMYRAPELLFKAKYGLPVDIWSAGCVFAFLLLKKPLFTGDSELAVLKSIFSLLGTPSEAIWPGFGNILQIGTNDEKVISESQPFTDIKSVFVGVPEPSFQLLQDMMVYYPEARLRPSEVPKSPFILDTPPECSQEKMKLILGKSCSASALLDPIMQVDG